MAESHNALAIPLQEFDYEMGVTRSLLERVPSDRADFKPHEKSFSLAHLAQLVAMIPGWITGTLKQDSINLAGGSGYKNQETSALVELFDQNAKEAKQALQDIMGEALESDWSLKMGDDVLMTSPRGIAARQHLNHLIHHRGQLSVYLRMVEVKLPSIYGPTADTGWR